jgi:branched-chain amino acid transport system substrate-binding protein
MNGLVHRLWAVVPVGLVVLVAVVCLGWGSVAGAAEAVKLGAVVPLTGRYGGGGAQNKAGYEIAVETITRAGGVTVGGKKLPLQLVLLDDESDGTKTVARLETLAAQGVAAYLGGFGSDLHAAAAAVAEKNKIPYCGVAFALYSIHQRGYRYLFSPFWKSPDIAKATFQMLNEYLPDAQRPKKVAIFQEKTDWGKELGDLWVKEAAATGYQIVLRAEYAVGSKDFSDIILRAKSAGAESLLSLPNPPDGMAILKQMQELDYTPKFAFTIRAPDPPVWSRNLGKAGDYTVLGPGWHNGVKYPGVAELNQAHLQRVGRPADPITGPSYACVQIVANAIEQAGSLDREKIRDAMAATGMTTVVGPVRFNPDGTGQVRAVMVQWLDGTQELVWPKEFSTKPFAYPAPAFKQR